MKLLFTILMLFTSHSWAQATMFAPWRTIRSEPSTATYKDAVDLMQQIAKEHPNTAKMFELGTSDSGESIQGLILGTPNANSINTLVVGTHHGNEYGATEVAKALALSLAEKPIAGQIVYLIPVLNTSGYDQKNRLEAAGGQSFDPNRDYPGPCGSNGPFKLKSTALLAKFIDQYHIVTSATLHTYFPAVCYPWGLASKDLSTPYDDIFKKLGEAAVQESHYQSGNSTQVIYPANGTFEDYAFWKHGIWSLLFELGPSHHPTLEQVEQMVQVNVPGLRRFLEQAPRQNAAQHDFTGKCDRSLQILDQHDE